MNVETTSVLIVGGGPCGLMLANELGRRGVAAILVDQKPSTAFNPQANATQARTMEHFRRLGFVEEIRAQDRKSTRLNSSHNSESRMPSSA
jgi:2-polyprenyl-6-methoxyphenol hydroxylase-like FAD-dependent oxidoreductase